jgi:hypothetical protein
MNATGARDVERRQGSAAFHFACAPEEVPRVY